MMSKQSFGLFTANFLALSAALVTFSAPADAQMPAPQRPQSSGQAQGGPPAGPPRGPAPDSLTLGLGAGISNLFPGSKTLNPLPFPSIDWRFDGRTIRTAQFGFEADLTRGMTWDFGPIVRINTGRDDFQSADNTVIEALGSVNAAVEVGGFVATTRPIKGMPRTKPLLFTARASVVKALGGHDGVVVEGSAGLVKPSRTWSYIGNLGLSYASAPYQRAFFGVDAAGSAASGLAQYEAGSGLRDVSATGIARYRINDRWSALAIGSYSRLVGPAANSPVVTQQGTPNQVFFGLNISYKIY